LGKEETRIAMKIRILGSETVRTNSIIQLFISTKTRKEINSVSTELLHNLNK
jgi:hypothetical protein